MYKCIFNFFNFRRKFDYLRDFLLIRYYIIYLLDDFLYGFFLGRFDIDIDVVFVALVAVVAVDAVAPAAVVAVVAVDIDAVVAVVAVVDLATVVV